MWAGIKASGVELHRQRAAAPPNKRSAICNDIPRVMYVHIRKLNFMKKKSPIKPSILFLVHLAAISAYSHFSLGKQQRAEAPGFTLGPWSVNYDIPHIVSQCKYWNACSLPLSSLSVEHALSFDVKEKSPLYNMTLHWAAFLKEPKTQAPFWPPWVSVATTLKCLL